MRIVIAFIFMAIFSSCLGLMIDTFGCMKPSVKLVRRNAVFHIVTVIFCLAINGFCFWVSERMFDQQAKTRLKKGKKIDVAFDVSYYLIVTASGLSILATAFTLIRRYPNDEDEQIERLLEEYTGGYEESLHVERSLPAPPSPPPGPPPPPPLLLNPLPSDFQVLPSTSISSPQEEEPLASSLSPATTSRRVVIATQQPPQQQQPLSHFELPPPYDPTPEITWLFSIYTLRS